MKWFWIDTSYDVTADAWVDTYEFQGDGKRNRVTIRRPLQSSRGRRNQRFRTDAQIDTCVEATA